MSSLGSKDTNTVTEQEANFAHIMITIDQSSKNHNLNTDLNLSSRWTDWRY